MAINKLIFAFVTLILGVALLAQIATITNDATAKTRIYDEAISVIKSGVDVNETYVYQLAQSPSGWKLTDCALTSLVLANASGGTAWTITTDYTVTLANGTLLLVNTSTTQLTAANLTYASYDYCADDYINSGWGRTTLDLIAGFFAIALLLISIGMFYSVAKESGIVG